MKEKGRGDLPFGSETDFSRFAIFVSEVESLTTSVLSLTDLFKVSSPSRISLVRSFSFKNFLNIFKIFWKLGLFDIFRSFENISSTSCIVLTVLSLFCSEGNLISAIILFIFSIFDISSNFPADQKAENSQINREERARYDDGNHGSKCCILEELLGRVYDSNQYSYWKRW